MQLIVISSICRWRSCVIHTNAGLQRKAKTTATPTGGTDNCYTNLATHFLWTKTFDERNPVPKNKTKKINK